MPDFDPAHVERGGPPHRYGGGPLEVTKLHVGPYEEEAPTIERLLGWIANRGLVKNGAHHEVYLDDPRTTAPERLRTIVRQPVRPA